jgi:hypothetical protein
MAGLGQLALGAAPIAGGALLAVGAGQFKGTDLRAPIKQDLDLLERLPEKESARRAELMRIINMRIDDLVVAADRSRSLREAAISYKGNWRDIVLFLSAMLFTFVWWHVSHQRSNWLLMFIVMILLSLVTFVYAIRGLRKSFVALLHQRRHRPPDS